ncbi:uncharacterized protein LOC135810228 [Sycon ciliatum]|uniref:uncharacterized protein LOC135810228 n=1 Tax=Sycon ciliatum TaxID=27933 RepID=UPI0020ACFE35|eukprot:scpid62162/ scgid27158/ 
MEENDGERGADQVRNRCASQPSTRGRGAATSGDAERRERPQAAAAAAAADTERAWAWENVSDRHVLFHFGVIFGAVFVTCVILLHWVAFVGRDWSAHSLFYHKLASDGHHPPWVRKGLSLQADQGQSAGEENVQDFWSQWHTLESLSRDWANSSQENAVPS